MYINCTATVLSNTKFFCTLLFLSLLPTEAESSKYLILSTYLQKYSLQDNRKHTFLLYSSICGGFQRMRKGGRAKERNMVAGVFF